MRLRHSRYTEDCGCTIVPNEDERGHDYPTIEYCTDHDSAPHMKRIIHLLARRLAKLEPTLCIDSTLLATIDLLYDLGADDDEMIQLVGNDWVERYHDWFNHAAKAKAEVAHV